MKSTPPNLVILVLLCAFLFSCSEEENGIYFNEINEHVNLENVTYTDIESEILSLVNQHRKNLGLSILQKLNIISGVADSHTNYMIEIGQLSHDNFAMRSQYLMNNANAKSVGENVAYGYNSAQGVFNGWLNSDVHRKVIENPNYTHFGISTELNSVGRNYFTQIYIKKE